MKEQQLFKATQKITDLICDQGKPVLLLSDFDGTLCDTYDFDQSTNNHLPNLDPAVIQISKNLPVIVATARRAEHPWLPNLWTKGLVGCNVPVITENGGALSVLNDWGRLDHWLQINSSEIEDIAIWAKDASLHITDLPTGHKIASKIGKTMMVLRVQDEDGHNEPEHQKILHTQLLEIDKPDGIAIVNGGGSLTIQSERISKARTFHKILNMLGIERNDVFVVSLGDGENDKSIFEESDLSIGVSQEVSGIVDIALDDNVNSALSVLTTAQGSSLLDLDLAADKSNIKQRVRIEAGIWIATNDISRKALISRGWNL